MKSLLLTSALILSLAGCSTNGIKQEYPMGAPAQVQASPTLALTEIPEINGEKITIGVYSFTDKTGQRAPNDNFFAIFDIAILRVRFVIFSIDQHLTRWIQPSQSDTFLANNRVFCLCFV